MTSDELAAGHPQLTNLVFAQNQGKGAALRIGLARGRGRYLGFIDADGDLDPILLDSFQTMVRLYSPDITSQQASTRSLRSSTHF